MFNVGLLRERYEDEAYLIDEGIDVSRQSEYRPYIGDHQRIEQAITSLSQYQGRIPRESIERAIDECIAFLQMALPSATNVEQLERDKQLIGRLWLFAEENNNERELIDELVDSYDLRRQTFVKGTIQRLVETALLEHVLGLDTIEQIEDTVYDSPLAVIAYTLAKAGRMPYFNGTLLQQRSNHYV